MGVSITMRPGTVMRSKGGPVDITPGLRSRAATILRTYWGDSPMEINRDDLDTLAKLANGASVYASEDDNIWLKIMSAVNEHDACVIQMEY